MMSVLASVAPTCLALRACGTRPSVRRGARLAAARSSPAPLSFSGGGFAPAKQLSSGGRHAIARLPARGAAFSAVFAAAAGDKVELMIDGMMCEGCTSRVTEALQALPEVEAVEVTLEPGAATVELAEGSSKEAVAEKLVKTVAELGFETKQAA
mmetsp:Transcript_7343/g.18953  ORF Transcript_7343/g.18953 Transcript_7343/m.18953 type:complete len:154 (+) Transcript_7343:519-980(+)